MNFDLLFQAFYSCTFLLSPSSLHPYCVAVSFDGSSSDVAGACRYAEGVVSAKDDGQRMRSFNFVYGLVFTQSYCWFGLYDEIANSVAVFANLPFVSPPSLERMRVYCILSLK